MYCRKMGLRRQKHQVWETELVDELVLDLCFFLFKKCGPYRSCYCVFKQNSPLVSKGYSAQKSMEGVAPMFLPTLIQLLIINNFTDVNEAKYQDSSSANLNQEFPGKLAWHCLNTSFCSNCPSKCK